MTPSPSRPLSSDDDNQRISSHTTSEGVPNTRKGSPTFGFSTLITSALNSPNVVAEYGAAMNVPRSSTLYQLLRISNISAVFSFIRAISPFDSTFNLTTGSVLELRRLNRQLVNSRLMPSVSS